VQAGPLSSEERAVAAGGDPHPEIGENTPKRKRALALLDLLEDEVRVTKERHGRDGGHPTVASLGIAGGIDHFCTFSLKCHLYAFYVSLFLPASGVVECQAFVR